MNQLIAPFVLLETKRTKIWQSILFSRNFHIIFILWKPIPSPCYRHPCNRFTENSFGEKKQASASASEDAEAGSYLWLRKLKKSGWGLGWGRIRTKMGRRRVESLRERKKVQPPTFCSSTRKDKKIPRTQKNRHPGNWSPAAGTRLISDENLSP